MQFGDGFNIQVVVYEADAQEGRQKKKQSCGRKLQSVTAQTECPEVFLVRTSQTCFWNNAILQETKDEETFRIISLRGLKTCLECKLSSSGGGFEYILGGQGAGEKEASEHDGPVIA